MTKDTVVKDEPAEEVLNWQELERGSEEWESFIRSQFTDKELIRGNPKVAALHRVFVKYIGEIIDAVPNTVQGPCVSNERTAVVEFTIEYRPLTGEGVRRFGDVADACPDNIPDSKFKKYPSAIASTRAFGRTLRRILQVPNMIAAEEVEGEILGSATNRATDEEQITYLNFIATRRNVNAGKLVLKHMPGCKDVKSVSYDTMLEIFSDLQKFNDEEIPEELQGYSENWKEELTKQ